MDTLNANDKGLEHNYHDELKIVVTCHSNTQIWNLKQFMICLDFDSIDECSIQLKGKFIIFIHIENVTSFMAMKLEHGLYSI